MTETIKTEPTYTVTIFLSGDTGKAREVCRRFAFLHGACVTVTETYFVYTGGAEEGVVIGLVNYPRFPRSREQIWGQAEQLARMLVDELCQWSVLLVAPDRSTWITRRVERENG